MYYYYTIKYTLLHISIWVWFGRDYDFITLQTQGENLWHFVEYCSQGAHVKWEQIRETMHKKIFKFMKYGALKKGEIYMELLTKLVLHYLLYD